jgi:hypothetical protein
MARIKPIVDAIAEVLRGIEGMTVYTEPVGTVETPAAIVLLGAGDYLTTMAKDSRDFAVAVDLFVSTGPQGMEKLYSYLDDDGPNSIDAALDDDESLGDLVDSAQVASYLAPDRVEMSNGEFYHVELVIRVMARGVA